MLKNEFLMQIRFAVLRFQYLQKHFEDAFWCNTNQL